MSYFKYILLSSLFFFTACENYLDEEPLTDVSIDFLYNTPEGLKAGLVGLYSLNRSHFHIWPNESTRPLWEYVQHDLVIPVAGYISVVGQFKASATSPSAYGSSITKLTWRDYYKVIDRANALIQAAEKIEGMDEQERLEVIAVSKYFRAHSLFVLWRLFNNVYIKTAPTTPENVFDRVSQPNTKEEIFAAIGADLDFAIENLPWTAEPGRVTQALARHIRAKLALWEENWQLAAELSESIINSGFYYLEPDPKKVFGHPSLPGYGNRNSNEALFVIQNEEGSAGAGPPHFINVNFMARYDDIPGAKWDIAQGGRGFAFCFPNEYLLGLYESFDKRLEAYYQTKFYYNDEENIPDSVLTDNGYVYPTLGDEIKIVTTGSAQSFYYKTIHPSLLKFFDENIPGEAAVSRMNILRYRLAETYIIGAEAYMRMGNQGKALEMINPLQARAGVPPISNLTELELMKEHARELAFEGQRFFFLKRIGKFLEQVQRFSGDNDYKNDGRANVKAHYVNLPIPESELELLGEGYPQNDGY